MTDPRDYSPRLKDCILAAVLGEQLGRGCFRTVFALDEERVAKVEADGDSFSNAHEWAVWREVEGTKWEKWFAPCFSIDAFGVVLIQARTTPVSPAQWKRLKEVPNFMADLKAENFGMLNGRIVCHDYGNHAFFRRGLKRAAMVSKDA